MNFVKSALKESFVMAFGQFETAASEVLGALKSKVTGETGEMEEPTSGEVQILLCSKENVISMRSLGVSI